MLGVDHGEPRQGQGFLWAPRRLRVAPQSREDDLRTANRFAVLRGPEEESAQAVSPGYVVPSCRRAAVAENAQPVSKRLRLTSGGSAVDTSPDTVVDALEFDLTREDSSGDEMCPDAEVGATVVDLESRDSQPVRSTTIDSDGSTPYQSTIPFGVTGDQAPSIHTSDTESIARFHFRSASSTHCSPVGTVLCQFRVAGVRGSGVSVCQERMFDESSPRVHEGSLPVSDAHRFGRDRLGPFSPCHSACVPRLEVVLCSTDLPEEARFRKHSCNVGWKHSRVESGHLFWPANESP